MPTARAMPISGLRSAASMTKIRKISMTPAIIEKRPMMMNIDRIALAIVVARSRRSDLMS